MTDEVTYRSSSLCPNGQCVEAAQLPDGSIAVRDSKELDREPHTFTREEWDAFIQGVKAGEFDFSGHLSAVLVGSAAD